MHSGCCCGKSLRLCDPEQLHLQAGGQGAFPVSLAGSFEDKNAKVEAQQSHKDSFPMHLRSPRHQPITHPGPSSTQMKNQINASKQASRRLSSLCRGRGKEQRNPRHKKRHYFYYLKGKMWLGCVLQYLKCLSNCCRSLPSCLESSCLGISSM